MSASGRFRLNDRRRRSRLNNARPINRSAAKTVPKNIVRTFLPILRETLSDRLLKTITIRIYIEMYAVIKFPAAIYVRCSKHLGGVALNAAVRPPADKTSSSLLSAGRIHTA